MLEIAEPLQHREETGIAGAFAAAGILSMELGLGLLIWPDAMVTAMG